MMTGKPETRGPGFYWIRSQNESEWRVANWDGEFWADHGSAKQLRDYQIGAVDECQIKRPPRDQKALAEAEAKAAQGLDELHDDPREYKFRAKVERDGNDYLISCEDMFSIEFGGFTVQYKFGFDAKGCDHADVEDIEIKPGLTGFKIKVPSRA